MTFTVTWKPSAIEALATLWLDSARRDSGFQGLSYAIPRTSRIE